MIVRHKGPYVLVLSLLAVVMLAPNPALAQAIATKAERVEINKLVQQRNKLFVRLQRLDKQASDLMKQGRDPVVVHADQVSIEDQLDLVELRLAILATNKGLTVPPLPGSKISGEPTGAGEDSALSRKAARAFARGRSRTLARLEAEARQFLRSLDFTDFLRN